MGVKGTCKMADANFVEFWKVEVMRWIIVEEIKVRRRDA